MNNAEVLIKFKADDTEAEKTTKKWSEGLKTAGKVGATAFAAIGTASVATTKALWDGVNATAQYGDQIDKTSQKVGMGTEAYQKWDYAMKISGTEMANCTVGLKTLTNKLDDFKAGSSGATAIFERLGISLEDVSSKSREDIFQTTVYALQNIEDATEKAAIANDLFGRSGQDLMPMFNLTNEELDSLMKEAEDYGMVMSEEAVKSSAAFQDSLTKLQGSFKGVTNGIFSNLMPGLSTAIDGFSDLIAGVDGGKEKIQQGMSQVMTQIIESVPKVIELIVGLAPDLIMALAEGLKSVAVMLSEGDTVETIINALIDGIIAIAPTIIESAIVIIIKLAEGLIKAIPKLLAAIPKIIGAIISGFAKAFPSMAQIGLDLVKGIWNGIKGATNWVLDKIKGFGKAVVDGIKGIFGIHSPSKVMADQIGQYLPKGMAVGITANADSVYGAINDIEKDINSTFGMGSQFTNSLNPTLSPVTNVYVNSTVDPLGQVVNNIKTFSGGAKNDYNYGFGGA